MSSPSYTVLTADLAEAQTKTADNDRCAFVCVLNVSVSGKQARKGQLSGLDVQDGLERGGQEVKRELKVQTQQSGKKTKRPGLNDVRLR